MSKGKNGCSPIKMSSGKVGSGSKGAGSALGKNGSTSKTKGGPLPFLSKRGR